MSPNPYNSPGPDFRTAQKENVISERGERVSYTENGPIPITQKNYFSEDCRHKHLHFFIPSSKELKILDIEGAHVNSNWKSITFKSKQNLPCFFKSIITPQGDIYLTGGSECN